MVVIAATLRSHGRRGVVGGSLAVLGFDSIGMLRLLLWFIGLGGVVSNAHGVHL